MADLISYLGVWFLSTIPVGLFIGQLLARAGAHESEPAMAVATIDDDVLFIVK